eukprot:6482580-Amphidinium_carterae.1
MLVIRGDVHISPTPLDLRFYNQTVLCIRQRCLSMFTKIAYDPNKSHEEESDCKKAERDKTAELEKMTSHFFKYIYKHFKSMLLLPTTHQNKRDPPTSFEGNNKSAASSGSTTTFKNFRLKQLTPLRGA